MTNFMLFHSQKCKASNKCRTDTDEPISVICMYFLRVENSVEKEENASL